MCRETLTNVANWVAFQREYIPGEDWPRQEKTKFKVRIQKVYTQQVYREWVDAECECWQQLVE